MIPPNSNEADYNGNGHSHGNSATSLLIPPRAAFPAEPLADWNDSKGIWSAEPQAQGLNLMEFVRALRRRWRLSLGVATGAALVVMVIVFLMLPPSQEATAIMLVQPTSPAYLSERGANKTVPAAEIERIQQIEIRKVKSEAVLQAVARDEDVMETSLFQMHKDEPIRFLNQELLVGFYPKTDYMYITMKGDNPKELVTIVDTVVAEYNTRFAEQEKKELLKKIEDLKGILTAKREELRNARARFTTLVEETGIAKAETGEIALGILLDELAQMNRDQSDMQRKANDAISRAVLEQDKLTQFKRRGIPESIVEQELAKDPNYNELRARALQIEQAYRAGAGVSRDNRSVQGIAQAYQDMQRQLADYRRQAGVRLKKLTEDQLDMSVRLAKSEAQVFGQRALALQKNLDKAAEEIKKKGRANEELAEAEDQMNRLDAYLLEKSKVLDNWELEKGAQARIQPYQPAMTPDFIDSMMRWWLTFGSGCMTFGACVLLVGGWEYLKRRLGNVNEVSKELGLNLVGTVPALPKRPGAKVSRRMTAGQFDALLSDSIDSIRATLIHGAGSNGHRTVMVTSAWDGEGKTTVASQLAASLARCGRRTLLVDADIRNPTLHHLFELPADVGLCEVLRGEVETHQAVRQTPADNLWLLSTGNCDYRSIQGLENDSLSRIFARLKAEYDFVVIDTAPVLAFADPLLIGQHVDGAILSVRLDYTQRPKVEEAVSRLRGVGIHIFGAVVNGTKAVASRRAAEPALIAAS